MDHHKRGDLVNLHAEQSVVVVVALVRRNRRGEEMGLLRVVRVAEDLVDVACDGERLKQHDTVTRGVNRVGALREYKRDVREPSRGSYQEAKTQTAPTNQASTACA